MIFKRKLMKSIGNNLHLKVLNITSLLCNFVCIFSNCEKLDVYLYKVPLAQRPNYKMRCDQLKYDNRHLQVSIKFVGLNSTLRKD